MLFHELWIQDSLYPPRLAEDPNLELWARLSKSKGHRDAHRSQLEQQEPREPRCELQWAFAPLGNA